MKKKENNYLDGLYQKVMKLNKSPIRIIAEEVGVTTEYVRQVLCGKRDGTKRKNGKGALIFKLAKEIAGEEN